MMDSIIRRNNVHLTGNGPESIVFAHGFGCDQNMWRFVAPQFEATYGVVLFDYVGCGQADVSKFSPERYSTLQGYVQDLIEVCDAAGVKGSHFVGHSVSAIIGALASIERTDLFKSLIMVGPSPR